MLSIERARLSAQLALQDEAQTSAQQRLHKVQGAMLVLDEQLAQLRLRSSAKNGLVRTLASYSVEAAKLSARLDSQQVLIDRAKADDAAIARRITSLDEEAKAKLLADEQRRKEEELKRQQEELKRKQEEERQRAAKLAQEQARQDAEVAREQERAAKTEEIKQLYAKQATFYEKISDLEAKKLDHDKRLKANLEATNTLFSTRKAEVKLLLERFVEPRSTSKSKDEIDPKFEEVRQYYRAAISLYRAAERELAASLKRHKELSDAISALNTDLEELEQDAKIGSSDLASAKKALIQTQLKSLQLELELEAVVRDDARLRLEQAEQKIVFYKDAREQLLERASDQATARFYDLTRDENWQDALSASKLAATRISTHAQRRLWQVVSLPSQLTTVSFWSWVFGLLIRLGVVVLGLRYLRRESPKLVMRLAEWLLKRKFFRARPSLAIKGSEVLQHIVVPLARFIAFTVIVRYVAQVLPEAAFVQLAINAFYIFKLTTITVSVLILPKALRTQHSQDNVDMALESLASQDVDLFKLEIDRARKFVRSAKIIIWFWLIVLYLPELVIAFLGHSVVWRVIDLASKWFLVIVIYSVLTTWKDEIAALFEKIAAERLPRAVSFVNSNKNKIWGVLVIAAASLYVLGKESVRLGREYLVEREWSKRISNFIFRKKIELQQREQEKHADEENARPELLPLTYRQVFMTSCLLDEPYRVDRSAQFAPILDDYKRWRQDRRQGSVAFIGESGIGKTTLLNQLALQLREADAPVGEVLQATCFEKLTTERASINFLCDLFDLQDEPSDKEALVASIRALEPRVILLDDCHHLFMRKISGFSALELFLEVVNLTDERHFWVLSFNRFAWYYLTRVRRREHFFGRILTVEPWSEDEIQALIWTRNLTTGKSLSFTDLVVTHQSSDEFSYEVVKSSRGYFRLLHEFSKGNPKVAMTYWLRSLKLCEDPETLQVVLFKQSGQKIASSLPDDYWFALTAIAQHGALTAREMSQIINAEHGLCEMIVDYFAQLGVVKIDSRRRASLSSVHFRQVIRYLADSNYLYG